MRVEELEVVPGRAGEDTHIEGERRYHVTKLSAIRASVPRKEKPLLRGSEAEWPWDPVLPDPWGPVA